MTKQLLECVGVDSARLRLAWVSASEGGKFAEVIKTATDEIKKLGPISQIKRRNKW